MLFTKKNPIQISTKELIPSFFLDYCQTHSLYTKQVFFNISLPYVHNNELIEPYAAPLHIRLQNITNIKNYSKLTSCFYIKPFTLCAYKNKLKYLHLINKYDPDFICVGIDFKKDTILNHPCNLLYQGKKVIDQALNPFIKNKFIKFNTFLYNNIENKKVIYNSSVCIISNSLNFKSKLPLYSIDKNLCRNCTCCFDKEI